MIIECIPNVSEGCRLDLISTMSEAIRKVPGVRLLNSSSDPSHNRSVFTFVGDASALEQAVLVLVERAIAVIDLRTQRGVHPRVGAVDVIPFVPIADVTMGACVALAKRVGAAIADRFSIPVYLYEEAASQPVRRRLENIRRGEFEGLAAKMASPDWAPDFGPATPHPTAGASIVGARMPLVAYNVNLATDRLDVAKQIAATVRQSSGGLPFVKAMGLPLRHRGIVQVSMNLTNYHQTPIARVFEAVKREAERHGVTVLESEIIGLVPADALPPDAQAYLMLEEFTPDRILENRLNS